MNVHNTYLLEAWSIFFFFNYYCLLLSFAFCHSASRHCSSSDGSGWFRTRREANGHFSSLPWRTLLSDHWSMIELSPSEPIRIMKSVGDVLFFLFFSFSFPSLGAALLDCGGRCSTASFLDLCLPYWKRSSIFPLTPPPPLQFNCPWSAWLVPSSVRRARVCECGRLLALEYFLFHSDDLKNIWLSTDHVKQFRCIDVPSMRMPLCLWLAITRIKQCSLFHSPVTHKCELFHFWCHEKIERREKKKQSQHKRPIFFNVYIVHDEYLVEENVLTKTYLLANKIYCVYIPRAFALWCRGRDLSRSFRGSIVWLLMQLTVLTSSVTINDRLVPHQVSFLCMLWFRWARFQVFEDSFVKCDGNKRQKVWSSAQGLSGVAKKNQPKTKQAGTEFK